METSPTQLAAYSLQIIGFCTDYGTESGIPLVPALSVESIRKVLVGAAGANAVQKLTPGSLHSEPGTFDLSNCVFYPGSPN